MPQEQIVEEAKHAQQEQIVEERISALRRSYALRKQKMQGSKLL